MRINQNNVLAADGHTKTKRKVNEMANEFAANLGFVKFLYMANTDTSVHDLLASGDTALISAYPGLSAKERKLLGALDWAKIELAVSEADISDFKAGDVVAYRETCEKYIQKETIEQKCYRL